MYIVDAMNGVHKTARRSERQMPCHQEVRDDDQETPINRGIHYRPMNTPPQPVMDTDHYLEVVDMPTDTDQESTTDTDHYDKPDELPYEGLDTTTVTPPVVQQQPSVYEDLVTGCAVATALL